MGSYTSTPAPTSEERPMHVLIAGGGIVGLTIAQGCRENGIPYTLFERDTEGSRSQGWALTLHWCLDALERTIGPERAARLPGAMVDMTLKEDAGNFLFLDCETGNIKYKIPPSKRRLRLHRQKLRKVLADGIVAEEGKKFVRAEEIDGGIRAHFADGTFADGTLLIGADGNHSNVRKFLLPEDHDLTQLPVHLVGVVRHFTAEQGAAVRAIDPLLFQGLHPKTENYLWYSIQEVTDVLPDGRVAYDALVIISWIMKDPVRDAIPGTHRERIAMMKQRAIDFAEPLRSIVQDIPDDLDFTTPLRLGDFPCRSWDNHGCTTLAGDAAHAMTMFRGEGANHGILDAALLVDQLKRIRRGDIDQKTALNQYEEEMRGRTYDAVLKSRGAALVAHEWDKVTEDSPVIGARFAPTTAFKSPFA